MARRIKSVSIRFNLEVRPFQHIRIECDATITKEDDPDEVRDELVSYAKECVESVRNQIYGPSASVPTRQIQPTTYDSEPFPPPANPY